MSRHHDNFTRRFTVAIIKVNISHGCCVIFHFPATILGLLEVGISENSMTG
jgi:hypothetical protein